MIIICVILSGVLQTICLLLGLHWLIRRVEKRLESRVNGVLTDWLTPEAEGKPHKLAQFLSMAGEVVGAAAARSIMASLNAGQSHVARVANGMTDELQGKANPLLGLLAGGKRGKGAAVMQLAQMLGPLLGGQGGNNHGSPGAEEYRGRKHRD